MNMSTLLIKVLFLFFRLPSHDVEDTGEDEGGKYLNGRIKDKYKTYQGENASKIRNLKF